MRTSDGFPSDADAPTLVTSPRSSQAHAALALPAAPVPWAPVAIGTPAAFALASLSGLAWAAGFPPLSWSIAPWVALVPLLVGCTVLSPSRAALAGMCWTLIAASGVASFLPSMLAGYFGLGTVTSWLGAVGMAVALHGVYVSAWAAWTAWLVRRRRASPLLIAGGWGACELARSAGLGGPWGLAATSQVGWTTLIQMADLAGPYGIGLLVAAVNACVAAALAPALRGRHPRATALVVAAALLAACAYGQWRLDKTFTDGDVVRVAVVQGGASVDGETARAERLQRYVDLTRRDAAPDADLIVWPEHAIDGYLEEPTATRDAVLPLGARADLIVGGPHFAPSVDGTRYHNSAYLVRDGRLASRYDKHRLVPFAEDAYTPGPGAFVVPARIRAGMLLCFEAMFPDLARRATAQGAEVLVNVSNDAWFGSAGPARQQLDVATLRAVENRRPLVRAAATGISAVIDAHGRVRAESGWGTHEVLNTTVRAAHGPTPYQRWGDAVAWLVVALVLEATLRPLVVPTARTERRKNR